MSDTSLTPEKNKDAQAVQEEMQPKDNAAVSDERQKHEPIKVLGIPMPGFINVAVRSVHGGLHNARMWSLRHMPRLIVNNSSNILGFTHVLTEMMMFKASNKDGKLVKDPSKPLNWVWEPFATVFEDTFKRSASDTMNVKEIMKGNPFKNFHRYVTDMDAATESVRNAPENAGKQLHEIRVGNSWVARSTLVGLTMWSLSALIPEKKESPEEIERMAIKRRNHPVGYVLERIKQGLWLPGWRTHKRQMLGIGNIALGITSAIGAWRGRETTKVLIDGIERDVQKYAFNRSYLGTAIVSMIAGLPLLFATDEQRGYGGFGAIMLGRIPFLFGSIKTKYRMNEAGKEWYLASSVSFQAENLSQALVGGAEKKPDGTIVDHTAVREQAREKAAKQREERHRSRHQEQIDQKDDVPSTSISQISDREMAMPQKQQGNVALVTS